MANPRAMVKWAVDLSPERRQYVQGLYPSVAVTDSIDAVLGDPEVDAVVIATPVATHHAIALKALAAGKHILVEKPMARSVQEVEEIGRAAEARGLTAMVGHTFLYSPAVRRLKEIVQSGELGEIRYLTSRRLNLGRIRSDVDALWNFAPHDVSIVQYLLDDPEPMEVRSLGMDYVQEGVADVAFLDIVYPLKVMAHIHVSWLDPQKVRQMTVVGSRKMALYDDVADNKIMILDKDIDRMAVLGRNMDYDHPQATRFSHRQGDIHLPRLEEKEPLSVEMNHFLDCIRDGIPCLTGWKHAREVVRILSAGKPAGSADWRAAEAPVPARNAG
jgi:predicted dehydrogenase